MGMSREGVPLLVIQRQLGHSDLAITSLDLRGIDTSAPAIARPIGVNRCLIWIAPARLEHLV
jgi:hypothetical protein